MDRLEKLRAKHRAEMKAEYDAIVNEITAAVTPSDHYGPAWAGSFRHGFGTSKMLVRVGLKCTERNRERVLRELFKRGAKNYGANILVPVPNG